MTRLVLLLNPNTNPVPWGPLVFASYASSVSGGAAEIQFDAEIKATTLNDTLNPSSITDSLQILEAIADVAGLNGESSKAASFIALYRTLSGKITFAEITAALDSLDDHLAYRTFLVGHVLSLADWAVWSALKSSSQALGVLKKNVHTHLARWYSHLDSLPSTQAAYTEFSEAKSTKKTAKASNAFSLGLPNAVEGRVVTRFPPEPSGYLHIGHAKAALLNQYFARMYRGKLIVRFDDTNPSKERSEFEETILEDLALMDVHGDVTTHTSDYFQRIYELCLLMIKRGNAYADDTEQLQMRAERMEGIASGRRDASVEENLARFAEMKKGTEEGQRWCIRAKISVDDPNKALRDPVIYRCNILPHHRTGSQWKAYPTYDFACPIVDHLEGVTHALRTNEYRDRNPQYQWMLTALGLPKIEVWDFSRINFIYTLLSKRKLHWFVDQGLVSGWDDPRFPTVRGIRRRGLTIEALRSFMLAQGPSQAQIMLEWDQIWAANKKVIDPIAPRFWAIVTDQRVPLIINGGPKDIEVKDVPKHKKNPDVGTKKALYSSTVFIEQVDAASFEDQEEITLMDWGNVILRKKTLGTNGEVAALEGDLFLEGDFKKTKKVTWLAEPSSSYPLPSVTLLDYDYLITKKKLDEEDNVTDFVTPTTEFRVEAYADVNIFGLARGDIIQFERKGFYILDKITGTGGTDRHFDFVSIPDATEPKEKKTAVPGTGGWGKNGPPAPAPPKNVVNSSTGLPPPNPNEKIVLSEGTHGFRIPITTDMYSVEPVTGHAEARADTTMYKVDSIYEHLK
ncbi:hypothetical protein BS47DRAFT_1481361 [Hydnum rufescens UP504]|uniref:glutamate--tRNA ligase n=1 Tax=Hydnum rufescens UP504 TaxID=1448309 RepID=A0A9P6DZJ7_9AGAM|nr:hypothetical protein BS47DRAFT_1481361 [Hydnum rufescens UP504]